MTGRRPPDVERRPGGRGRRSGNIAGGDAHTVARPDDGLEFRAWFGGRWFPGVELPEQDRERELGRLVAAEGWSLEEALAAVQPPSWFPADDPDRDIEDPW